MKFSETEFTISIKTLQNLEPTLVDELTALGVSNVTTGRRIVQFKGDLKTLYRVNLNLRTALRVLVPILEFPIRQADDIYTQAMKFDWTEILGQDQTFAIDPNINSEFINHSNYASVKLKDAIADTFKNKFGRRPDVNPDNPDVLFNLHADNHRVTISLDSSGESLNRRGYRSKGAKAPLNEVLAAGMLLQTGWKGETDFYDPMCGSGTLAIEANMIAQNLPAQFLRNEFGFTHWKNFNSALWSEVKKDAREKIIPRTCNIYASDVDKWQVRAAKDNLENAGFEEDIQLEVLDFFETEPKSEKGIMIFNPPYGERITNENILLLYKNIGNHLKHHWQGHTAWIVSANEDAIKCIGLKPSKKLQLINGTLPCKFMRFDLFAGKRVDTLVKS